MNNHHRPYGAPEHPDEQEQQTAAALDAFIAALDDDPQPTMPAALPPDDMAAFEMAARLHQHPVTTTVATPSADFVASLGARLAAQLAASSGRRHDASAMPIALPTPDEAKDAGTPPKKPAQRPPSRRAVLTGGLAAAAGLAAGVAGGVLVEHAAPTPSPSGPWTVALVGGNGVWQAVARVADIAPGTVKRFATTNLVGHVIRRNDGSFYALSAACTHMGCIVAWNVGQRTFDCPCHNGRFDGQGTALPNQSIPYRPLPTIATKVADDQIYVWVPASTAPTPTAATTPNDTPAPYEP